MNPFYLRMIRAAVMQTDGPKKTGSIRLFTR